MGKTALTRLLGERLQVPTMFEQFETNPFLGSFYTDRVRYAFQTEVFFLLNRYRQQQSDVKPLLESSSLVADYLFAKTRMFAGMNLLGDELGLFDQIYDALSKQLAQPDLVVYLTASLDTLMARIYQRDRSFERSMDQDYIAQLSQVYEEFFQGYTGAPLLHIETDQLDLVRDERAQQRVIAAVFSKVAWKGKE